MTRRQMYASRALFTSPTTLRLRPLTTLRAAGYPLYSIFKTASMDQRSVKAFADSVRPGEGDFGARDPFPEELASNFADKVLGNADTQHRIKPPDSLQGIIGLQSKKCVPCEGGVPSLTEKEIELMRNQIPGWQIVSDSNQNLKIKSEWRVKNFLSALELFRRVGEIAEAEGHHPDLHLTSYNNVCIELSTHSVQGLTENDFIIAAKINALDVSDLLKKKKKAYWA